MSAGSLRVVDNTLECGAGGPELAPRVPHKVH